MEAYHPPRGTSPYWDMFRLGFVPFPAYMSTILLYILDHDNDVPNVHLGVGLRCRSQDSREEVEAGISAHNVLGEPHIFLRLPPVLDTDPLLCNREL